MDKSVPAEYFVELYRRQPDPWNFAGSAYEAAKYDTTLRTLPRSCYGSACELGCSIGVFTAMLAPRCGRLVAVDVSEDALAAARARCADSSNVRFLRLDLLQQFPHGSFDLVTVCEIGYYFGKPQLERLRDAIAANTISGGDVVLVHWTPKVPGHALSTDDVHTCFLADERFRSVVHREASTYRVDVVRRTTG